MTKKIALALAVALTACSHSAPPPEACCPAREPQPESLPPADQPAKPGHQSESTPARPRSLGDRYAIDATLPSPEWIRVPPERIGIHADAVIVNEKTSAIIGIRLMNPEGAPALGAALFAGAVTEAGAKVSKIAVAKDGSEAHFTLSDNGANGKPIKGKIVVKVSDKPDAMLFFRSMWPASANKRSLRDFDAIVASVTLKEKPPSAKNSDEE